MAEEASDAMDRTLFLFKIDTVLRVYFMFLEISEDTIQVLSLVTTRLEVPTVSLLPKDTYL
jgi:hypothetical protein